ncbi:MAG: tRNA (adenosine(37)-N6)-threonylcarbamoyltransferase complex ATPase subunit type 1 TsaE [Candidatus Symbiodolus clandestinus]
MEQRCQNLPSVSATEAFGSAVARACQKMTIFYLVGELGTGKTTWCRGFLSALGYTGAVKSPTYTLVEPYRLCRWQVYHWDLYRLNNPEELETVGIRDYQQQENSLQLIEWPGHGVGWLPLADVEIQLLYSLTGRQAILQACSLTGQQLFRRLENA